MAGSIPACKWVKAACARHLADLGRQSDPSFRWVYDAQRAVRVVKFIQGLPHVKGRWALRHERITLELWQMFIVCSLFGWVEKASGFNRFQRAYICVPRKNGKSVLAAAIGLYKFAGEGEHGAEVYSGATSEKQAWEVFRPARLMADRTQALRKAFGITVNAKSLAIASNGSRFEPVIGNPGDGASPSCAIVDEFHEHLSDSLHNTMLTGMGARDNPLLLTITTAGSDRSGPCYALQSDVQKMLDGRLTDDRLFGIVYTVDDPDDWRGDAALIAANPNLGVSVGADWLREQQSGAVSSARKQNVFKTKHLNIWVNADVAWMNMVAWDKCGDPSLTLEGFEGEECIVGLDLADRVDIASKIRLFRRQIDGADHFYAFASHFLNEARVEQSKSQSYEGWANQGLLAVTPGNVTDYGWIADELEADTSRFMVREIAHDPWHAAPLIQFVQKRPNWDQSVEPVEIRQSVQNMSPAMKELEGLVAAGRLHHDGDPILAWMMANVVCHRDAKENIFPRKERVENKIDGAVALIMAVGRATSLDGPGSVYDERGVMAV